MPLENKLGISSSAELALAEERISKTAALELYGSGRIGRLGDGTFASLSEIHRALFGDIYSFAGELRHETISKGGFRFAAPMFLPSTLQVIDGMPHGTFDQIVEKYVEMNLAHPFREGNGRSGRIWLDAMLRSDLGMTVDWSAIPRKDYLDAMERSQVKDLELKTLVREALSDDLESVGFLARSIDASYGYEGYDAFELGELYAASAHGEAAPVAIRTVADLDRHLGEVHDAAQADGARKAPSASRPKTDERL